ncbi:InlB B-repeat-containing protein [Mycoplasma sp. P36-A1]|uniref:InlB B-repeat-containing protein n=1 Tax=Mycoplasma sp. P36-A1 TaxID=3252900 RepID=UPI003C2F0B9A
MRKPNKTYFNIFLLVMVLVIGYNSWFIVDATNDTKVVETEITNEKITTNMKDENEKEEIVEKEELIENEEVLEEESTLETNDENGIVDEKKEDNKNEDLNKESNKEQNIEKDDVKDNEVDNNSDRNKVTTYTLTYISNNKVIDTQKIAAGSNYKINLVPSLGAEHTSFLGWYLDSNFTTKAKETITMNQSMSLYAKFSTTYNVNYIVKSETGSDVIKSITIEKNNRIDFSKDPLPTEEELELESGYYFLYWFNEKAEIENEFDFSTRINDNINLVAKISNLHYVTLNLNGGNIDDDIFINVEDGSTISTPNDPTRTGYTFKHWSTDQAGNNVFDFSTSITTNLNLYAIYDAQETTYNVAIWLEKSDNTVENIQDDTSYYNFVKNEDDLKAMSGSRISVSQADADAYLEGYIENNYNFLKYSVFNVSETKTINGNGRTTINVFYKRKVFNIEFSLDKPNVVDMNMNNVTYEPKNSRYVIKAKFEQNIKLLWPELDTVSVNAGYKMSGWNYSEANGVGESSTYTTGNPLIYSSRFIDNSNSEGVTIMYPKLLQDNNLATNKRDYYIEPVIGEFSDDDINESNYEYLYTQTYYTESGSANNYTYDDVYGFSCVKNCGTIATTTSQHFFKRNRHNITYDLDGGTINGDEELEINNVKFEAPVIKQSTPVKENYDFKGWFYDDKFMKEVNFENLTMPNYNLAIYAKWESQDVTINYLDSISNDVLADSVGVELGSNLVLPKEFVENVTVNKDKGVFTGWYIKNNGIYFKVDENTTVNKDINLYARWKTQGFTLTYDIEDGIGSAVVDNTKYNFLTNAVVKDFEGSAKDPDSVFIGWKKDETDSKIYYANNPLLIENDTVLHAIYAKRDTLNEITYIANREVNEPDSTLNQYVEKNNSYNLFGEVFTDKKNEMELVGWTSKKEPQSAKEVTPEYTLDQLIEQPLTSDKTLYGVWKHYDITLAFKADDHGYLEYTAQNVKQNYVYEHVYDNDDLSKLPIPKADRGYAFAGWDIKTPKIGDILTESKTYTAKFKKQASSKVIFKYQDENNKTLAKDKTVLNDFVGNNYDLRESKDIIKIDGYKYLKSSKPLYGQLNNKQETIVLTYKKNKAKVTINYIDKDTKEKIKDSKIIYMNYKTDYNFNNLKVDIAGYTFVKADSKLTGTLTNKDLTLNLIYKSEVANENLNNKLPITGQNILKIVVVILIITLALILLKIRVNKKNK